MIADTLDPRCLHVRIGLDRVRCTPTRSGSGPDDRYVVFPAAQMLNGSAWGEFRYSEVELPGVVRWPCLEQGLWMRFEVVFSSDAEIDLEFYEVFEQRGIIDGIKVHLKFNANRESKRRKK